MMKTNVRGYAAVAAGLVLLAACSGGGPVVSLTISPSSPSAMAGGPPVTLTATLTNASGTITWALVGVGSLSSTTGTTVSYVPPTSAAAATTATVKASGGGVTAEVTISIAPDGSGGTPSITITGPSTTQAGGAAVTYTATLTGGTGTITWSLTGGPGTLSTSSGATTSYTPPETVASATIATLTASAGGATSSFTITVTPASPPATITVSGTVVYPSQLPADGLTVVITGRPTTTSDASGRFSISGVTTPYDCTVLDALVGVSTTYVGLTRSDPTVQVFDLIEPRSGTLTGSVTPFSAAAMPPRVVFGSPEGAAPAVDGAPAGDPIPNRYEYELFPGWSGPTVTTGSVHALQWEEENGLPTTYAYGSQPDVEVPNWGAGMVPPFAMAPIGTSTLTGSIAAFEGAVLLSKVVEVHFKPAGLLPVVIDTTAPLTFSYAMPSLAPSVAAIDVTAAAALGSGDDLSYGYVRGLIPDGDAHLTLLAPPLASTPASGATGVGPTTDFTWSAFTGGVHVLVAKADGGLPWYYVVTSSTTARLPDLAAYGMPLPASADYSWEIRAYAPFTTVDAFGGPGEPLARSQQHGLSALRPFRTR
jgi:hypothetical protein